MKKYKSSETAVEAASPGLWVRRAKYEAGRSNIYTFDQVRLRLSAARSETAQAKIQFPVPFQNPGFLQRGQLVLTF